MIQTIKETLLKVFVLIFVFIGTISLYFFLHHQSPYEDVETLDIATLPIITATFESSELNALHGYVNEMEAGYMLDVVTPLESDRILPISIYRYSNTIVDISYEVRSLDTTRLIEDSSIESWEVNGDIANASIPISKIPEADEEYLLIIKLKTEKHGTIYYYSRIIEQTSSEVTKQLEFVNSFSNSTLDDEAFEAYIGNLEISPSRDNSNLADVDLTSSYNNLTWGNLKVSRVSEPAVSITEICGDTSCFKLKYKVRALNEFDTYQYYDVTEFFRLKQGVNTTYLYVYDRTLEQIFDTTTQNISSTRINLGLDSDLFVKYKTNSSGSFVSFVKNGNLWTMDMKKNQILSLFSFDNMNEDYSRVRNDQYDIEIISTDDSGNTLFLVYGYMETGAHEGTVGVSLYHYTYETNTATELVFVPSTKPFYVLKDSVGKFAYLTKDNLLYFMIGNSIYTVTMDSNEYVQLVSNLQNGNYIINSENNIIAWHENTSINSADSIRIIDVDKKQDYTVTANEGEYIKAIGFIENDLVYGTAKISDIYTDSSGNTVFPMYRIDILIHNNDSNTSEVETYAKDNVYITDTAIDNNTLSLSRVTKNADGSFSPISSDKFVNRSIGKTTLIEISTIQTDLKKTELVLNFAYTVTSSNDLKSVSTESFKFTSENKLNLSSADYLGSSYYVYAYGTVFDSHSDIKSAIECADKNYGMVVSNTGNIVWAKITKPNLAKLSDTATLVSKGYTNASQILNDASYNIYNLTGTAFANVLYYGYKDIAVITYTNELGYVIVSAYSSYLGMVDTIAFTSLTTGEITKMPYDAATAAIGNSGNIFYVMNPIK